MDRITQEAYHRQRILKWAGKHGATEAANRYHVSRKTVYKWLKRYDGSINSLKDRSRRPHHMPRQQTQGEWKLVKRYAGQYKSDLILGSEMAIRAATGASNARHPSWKERQRRKNSRGRTNPISAQIIRDKRCRRTLRLYHRIALWAAAGNAMCTLLRMSVRAGRTGQCTTSTAQPVPRTSWKSWSRPRPFRSG